MASNSKWPRSDTQSYTPQGHKSSAMSNATCWDYFSNDGLGFFDYQGSRRSSHPRQTTEEKLSRSFQQCTPFAEPRVPSPSPCAILDERLNKSDPSYPMIRGSQDYTASSSTETRRRTGTEDYPTQAWQYPPMAEDQSWKQNLGYSGQQQRFEEYYLHSSQPTQSDSYPTDFGDIYHPQQYSSSHAPSSYLDNNRMPSIASLGRSPYHALMMPVARPSIVVDEAQDNHICSLEEPAEGKLSVPRAPRRGQRDVDSQRRRRHLTPEGREHAKDVRKVHACKDCRRRKIKCIHVLERDLVSTPSPPGVQRDTLTSPHASSSPQPFRYHSPPIVQPALYPLTMNGFPYCPLPSPLPKAYTEQTYTDPYPRYQ